MCVLKEPTPETAAGNPASGEARKASREGPYLVLADDTKNSNNPVGMGGIRPLLPGDVHALVPRTCQCVVALHGSGTWQM